MNYSLQPYNNDTPFQFDFLAELIIETQRNRFKIQKEWQKIYRFLDDFPEFCQHVEDLTLKQELLIDSYEKIYRQMIKVPASELAKIGYFELYYYEYDLSMFDRWEKEQVSLGETDSTGVLNTGCCVIMKMVQVNVPLFVTNYLHLLN